MADPFLLVGGRLAAVVALVMAIVQTIRQGLGDPAWLRPWLVLVAIAVGIGVNVGFELVFVALPNVQSAMALGLMAGGLAAGIWKQVKSLGELRSP